VQSFNLGGLLPGAKPSEMAGSRVWDAGKPTGDVPSEILINPALMFDDLLFAAESQRMLPFVIGNPQVEAPGSLTEVGLELPVRNIGGVPDKLMLLLIIVEDGTWRVDRITWAGSNSEGRPWGVIADSP
jgi:hypothetical protein